MGRFFRRFRRAKRESSFSLGVPFLRFVGPGSTVVAIIAFLFFLISGRIDLSSIDHWWSDSTVSTTSSFEPVSLSDLGARSSETIRVATFNIQVFGDKKSSNRDVMAKLAKVVTNFDVVAIQEVRGGDSTPVDRLVGLINASGGKYGAVVSHPIGRTSQTECYAFVWDETRIQLVPQSSYVVNDEGDFMHREPMVASFQVRTGTADGRLPFRFTLINAHTSPKEVAANAAINEMNVLDDVFVSVWQYDNQMSGEEDCILLGDLNVDVKGLRELGQLPGVESVTGDMKTNTLKSKTYDHIVLNRDLTREFTGRFGVFDLETELSLSREDAASVSDHLPVWAEFSAFELPQGNRFANRQNGVR